MVERKTVSLGKVQRPLIHHLEQKSTCIVKQSFSPSYFKLRINIFILINSLTCSEPWHTIRPVHVGQSRNKWFKVGFYQRIKVKTYKLFSCHFKRAIKPLGYYLLKLIFDR
jgi:hypothetical protein